MEIEELIEAKKEQLQKCIENVKNEMDKFGEICSDIVDFYQSELDKVSKKPVTKEELETELEEELARLDNIVDELKIPANDRFKIVLGVLSGNLKTIDEVLEKYSIKSNLSDLVNKLNKYEGKNNK